VIEGKSFRRVGGSGSIAVDVAVIAAAHEDLAALAAQGAFRHDLYYRLIRDGMLVIPPLRDRPEDLAVLARHHLTSTTGRGDLPIEDGALACLAEYDWPGNVRQLYTALRIALRITPDGLSRAAVSDVLAAFRRTAARPGDRPAGLAVGEGAAARVGEATAVVAAPAGRGGEPCAARAGADGRSGTSFHAITARIQRRALLQAYEAAAGNKTAAGVLLGFHLSPGEEPVAGRVLTEARRNLALRKFRYWCSRLGLADALGRRPIVVGTLVVEDQPPNADP
jgi:transcriptional regulator of acetoin/glycerol metabolism